MSYTTYLAHHGIKGQKWGVRRFQNYDGTRIKSKKVPIPKGPYFKKVGILNRSSNFWDNHKETQAAKELRKTVSSVSSEVIAKNNADESRVNSFREWAIANQAQYWSKGFGDERDEYVKLYHEYTERVDQNNFNSDVNEIRSKLNIPSNAGAVVYKIIDSAIEQEYDKAIYTPALDNDEHRKKRNVFDNLYHDTSITSDSPEVQSAYADILRKGKSIYDKEYKLLNLVEIAAKTPLTTEENQNYQKLIKDLGYDYVECDPIFDPIATIADVKKELKAVSHSVIVNDDIYSYRSYLAHHGIKGQKWGVRRYQNEDGSLTSVGIKRVQASIKRLRKKSKKYNRKAKIVSKIVSTLSDDEYMLLNPGIPKKAISSLGRDYFNKSAGEANSYTAKRIIIRDKKLQPASYLDAHLVPRYGEKPTLNISVATANNNGTRGKGYADKAVKKMLKWHAKNKKIFGDIEWDVAPNNVASRRLAEKNGFEYAYTDNYNGWVRYIHHSALSHHGIKGQKWGVRRFQNPDGTLTDAGRNQLRINRGSSVTRVSHTKRDPMLLKPHTYVSLNMEDHKKWLELFGHSNGQKLRPVYSKAYRVKNTLFVARAEDIASAVSNGISKKGYYKRDMRMLEAEAKRRGYDWDGTSDADHYSLMIAEKLKTGRKIEKVLTKMGFEAMEDIHGKDTAENPIIILNPSKNLSKETQSYRHDEYVNAYKDYYKHRRR